MPGNGLRTTREFSDSKIYLSIILLRQLDKEAPHLLWRLEIPTLIGEKEKRKRESK